MVLLYDEDCGFCSRIASRLARLQQITAHPIGSDVGDGALRDLPRDMRYASMHTIDEQGRRASAGRALAELSARLPGGRLLGPAVDASPWLTERLYRAVAHRRHVFSRLLRSPACGRSA